MSFEPSSLLVGGLGLALYSALTYAIVFRHKLRSVAQSHFLQSVGNRGRLWHCGGRLGRA